MTDHAKCRGCGHVYNLGTVTVTARYDDCSVWKCPGCNRTVDDRPGMRGYVEVDAPDDDLIEPAPRTHHDLIARRATGPLGRRIKIRCKTHLVESADGDHEAARDWVKVHAKVTDAEAALMVRAAGRWA